MPSLWKQTFKTTLKESVVNCADVFSAIKFWKWRKRTQRWCGNWGIKSEGNWTKRQRKWRAVGVTVAAMKLLRSLKHSHKDFYKPKTLYVCLCMYKLTVFTVSTVLAGRSCLCLAVSHHLFLTRLLICPIIPSSLFLRRWGAYIVPFGLYPCLFIHLSFQKWSFPSLSVFVDAH